MAERGGQPGNQNATKGRPWALAIERALSKRSAIGRKEALDELAESLLAKCDQGDMAALKELGDRLDGRPGQAIVLGGDPDAPIVTRVERAIVDPAAGNT